MVSPTIGRHIVCTVQDAAERIGFEVTSRADECGLLTATDGHGAPAEHPGADGQGDPPPTGDGLKAGVGSADVSWHLGASGGQFAATEPPFGPDFVDPYFHATRKRPSDALYSRILTRALVIEGSNGERVAVIGNDLYLPNDILNRRVADLLEQHDRMVEEGRKEGPVTGVTADNLAVTVSHNHNSAFYSTPAWGTWIFQDVFDLRFFDYVARGMADAVIEAAGELRPVRMGGATVPFNEISSHTYGPKIAVDGTPAGQPYDHTTGMLSVVRFDDITDPSHPVPYANWVTLGIHPEWTWGYDVFNGDITHAAMRIIDRELGTTTVMSQRETGSSGPHKDTRASTSREDRREFQDNGFEQLDIGARCGPTRSSRRTRRSRPVRQTAAVRPGDARAATARRSRSCRSRATSRRRRLGAVRPAEGTARSWRVQLQHRGAVPRQPAGAHPRAPRLRQFSLSAIGRAGRGATPRSRSGHLRPAQGRPGVPIPESATSVRR
jgi:hypothetical protein